MKDKKQQIEEMARDIAKRDCHLYDNCPKPIKHNCVSQDPTIMLESSKNYITIATWLVNANYQKVDENSVVLTKEEYEYFMNDRDYWQEQYYKENEKYIKFIGEKLPELLDNNGKETAKNILNGLECFFWETAINDTKYFDLYQNLYLDIKDIFKNKYGITKEN